MLYVYLIQSSRTGKIYIGYTNDLRTRLADHNWGRSRATKAYAPYALVYYEAYRVRSDAMRRERKLKDFKQSYTRLRERIGASLDGQN